MTSPDSIPVAEVTVTVADITELADGSGANVFLDVPGLVGSLLWTTPDATGVVVGMTFNVQISMPTPTE